MHVQFHHIVTAAITHPHVIGINRKRPAERMPGKPIIKILYQAWVKPKRGRAETEMHQRGRAKHQRYKRSEMYLETGPLL